MTAELLAAKQSAETEAHRVVASILSSPNASDDDSDRMVWALRYLSACGSKTTHVEHRHSETGSEPQADHL